MNSQRFKANLMAIFLMIFTLLSSQVASALQPTTTWIVDEKQILQAKTHRSISQILAEFAQKKNIHLQIFIFDAQNEENIYTFSRHKMREWEAKYVHLQLKKTAYLFMNTQTGQSSIVLGKNTKKSDFMTESFVRIQSEVVFPALAQQHVDKAVWEGVIAVTAILNEWPAMKHASRLEQIINAIAQSSFFLLFKLLAGVLAMLCLRWLWLKLFTRPAWIAPTASEMQAIEAQIGYYGHS